VEDVISPAPVRRRSPELLRYASFALGAIVLIVGGLKCWLRGGRYVYTDDAYVQANVLSVSTDVSGIVDQVPVYEGLRVAGTEFLEQLGEGRAARTGAGRYPARPE
jgi:membrane fusion protein (multidrug efflux system)